MTSPHFYPYFSRKEMFNFTASTPQVSLPVLWAYPVCKKINPQNCSIPLTSLLAIEIQVLAPEQTWLWLNFAPWNARILKERGRTLHPSLFPRALHLLFKMQFIIIQNLATLRRVRVLETAGTSHETSRFPPSLALFFSLPVVSLYWLLLQTFLRTMEDMVWTTINPSLTALPRGKAWRCRHNILREDPPLPA